jgi:DNA adenine methylase
MPRATALRGSASPAAGPPPQPRAGIRPLLKWAGGKRQLLPAFRAFYPGEFLRYVEPFLGSGAVFFDLHAAGRLTGREAHLSDSNPDLIGCYLAVRDRPEAVIAALVALADGHAGDPAGWYYAVRERFNEARTRRDRDGAYSPELAAMLIYLNRTGFNGLFRVNGRGAFNVPAGRYARPRIVNEALVRTAAAALGAPGVHVACGEFAHVVAGCKAGDFLYFDPPYVPLSATSAFGAYTTPRFTEADQDRLCATVVALAARGAAVMLSNSSAPDVRAKYEDVARHSPGLALWEVPARRAINSHAGRRGPVAELLLTNLTPRAEEVPEGVRRVC